MGSSIPPSLRRIIADQAGTVSRRQVLQAGVSRSTIISKVTHGSWQPLHRGVYGAFTGMIRWEAHLWAAVLYAGPGALLSHETAAEVLGLTDRRCPTIHVTIPESRRVRPPEGVTIHLSSFDYPRWRPQRGTPPHTFYAETIIDLVAAADNLDDVVAWVSRGIARHLVGKAQLNAAVAAHRRFRWRDHIDEVIERVADGSHFPLEFRYDRDVERAHGLPGATRQAKFVKPDGSSGFRDRCYKEYGLIVELDGKQFHDAEQRGQDQARDNEAAATTGATLRYGWADVDRASCETAGQVYRALRKRGYRGTMRLCSATCRALPAPLPPASRRALGQADRQQPPVPSQVWLSHASASIVSTVQILQARGLLRRTAQLEGRTVPRPGRHQRRLRSAHLLSAGGVRGDGARTRGDQARAPARSTFRVFLDPAGHPFCLCAEGLALPRIGPPRSACQPGRPSSRGGL
jgi:hypothetical protein